MLTRGNRRYFVLVLLTCWTLPMRTSIADDVYTLTGHSLVVREAASGSIKATVPIGDPGFAGPCGLVAGAGRLFVVESCGGSRILVLDSASYEIVDEILLPCCISDLALSGDGSQLFALQNEVGGGAVLVWDVGARREVSGFGVGSGVRSLAVSNDRPRGDTASGHPQSAAVEGGCRADRGRPSWVMLSLAVCAIGIGYRRASKRCAGGD